MRLSPKIRRKQFSVRSYLFIGVLVSFLLGVALTITVQGIRDNSSLLSRLFDQSRLSSPLPSPELVEIFHNQTYRYSFRYPAQVTLVQQEGDELITLMLDEQPLLTFSIVTIEEEQRALERAIASIRGMINIQMESLATRAKGERVLGKGYPSAVIEPFQTTTGRGQNDPNALGFSLESNSSGVNGVFLRLYDGHVLHVLTEERSYETPDTQKQNEVLINAILRSINTFE